MNEFSNHWTQHKSMLHLKVQSENLYMTLMLKSLTLQLSPVLMDIHYTCVCRSELNSDSITCDIKTLIRTRNRDIWIGYENDYSSKVVQLVERHTILVLATMIFFFYTKLDMNCSPDFLSTNIMCTCVNNVALLRWYIDTNVQYVRDCYILLFLFSLAVLILLIIPYTFILLNIPLFERPLSKYMCCCQILLTYMKPFSWIIYNTCQPYCSVFICFYHNLTHHSYDNHSIYLYMHA